MADPSFIIINETGFPTKEPSVNKVAEILRQIGGDIAGSHLGSVNHFVDITVSDENGYSAADEVVESAKSVWNKTTNTFNFVDFIYDNWKMCLVGFLALVILLKD